ncbi:hypothetical protein HYW40_00015 [Candidatus Curtissbacteria bacterium]|nr:hypothetical protein [Candidatus Curtissbacteria bacterium]
MKNGSIVIFKSKADHGLTASEKKVVKKLIEAAKAIAPIYQKQENVAHSGANFYPHDATRDEIAAADKNDRSILSPYTVVERSKDGKLIAIPYHVKYKTQLEKVAHLLKEAADLTQNRDFAKRLHTQANALLDGTYEVSDIYWLTMKPYKIDIAIGPIERYNDQLFFTKCSYQAWVGIMDEKQTEDAVRFKDFIVSARRRTLTPSEKVDFLNKIQVRVDNTLIFSGLIAHFMFTSSNLPNDVKLMERYGSEITIFKESFNKKFDTEHRPIFHAIFEEKFQQGYPAEILRLGSLRNSYLHEISHPLLRYRDAEDRLKEYFPVFDEIAASVFGVKACGSLLLKDVISQKELEAIMVTFVARAFSWWISYLKEPGVVHYAQGFAIAINFFLENGAIIESGGFSWPNFNKMFLALEELSDSLETLISMGSYNEAKHVVEKYGSLEIFERFRPNLKNLI